MHFRSRTPCFRLIAILIVPVVSAGLAGCGKEGTDSATSDSAARGVASFATSDGMAGRGGVNSSASGGSGTGASAAGTGNAGSGAAVRIEGTAISTNLKAVLLADAMLKGTSISVESRNGEVVLTGTVNSQAQREHAAQIAHVSHGVQNVNNKLTVKQ